MLTGKTKIEPATAQDFQSFFGESAPVTMRAWVLRLDGEIVGIGGYFMAGARAVAFSDLREDIAAPKLTIWRAAKQLMSKITAPATCRSDNEKLMRSLGWRHVIGDVWECN